MQAPPSQGSPPSRHFPSPTLVVLSVASFDTNIIHLILPSTIGLIATLPYHVYMYKSAHAHRRSPSHSGPIFISNDWIIYNFLLITLWAVIFIINILFYVFEKRVFTLVATILSGFEWIILLILALVTIAEIRRLEPLETSDTTNLEAQPLIATSETTPLLAVSSVQIVPKTGAIYFISYTLCTLSLVLSVDLHVPIIFTVITFFLTAPHHIALYIASVRPNSPFNFIPSIAHPTNVIYAFFLCAIWMIFVILEILTSKLPYQSILLGIFGVLECVILTSLAVRSVVDSFSEGEIKL
ncbi:hypothetical protein DXG01_006634 [Tephrocybe rancida]|nr:hypothetical protein DXG01_006634 [Tephrocybe rancida]